MVKFGMCTLVSRDGVPFCNYIERYVYYGNQGTHDKFNQIWINNCPCLAEVFRDVFGMTIQLGRYANGRQAILEAFKEGQDL